MKNHRNKIIAAALAASLAYAVITLQRKFAEFEEAFDEAFHTDWVDL